MYSRHPSVILNQLFAEKPYQGVSPENADILFVGLDANYSATIEHQPIFPKICEYHSDGAAFWRKHRVHHPFLLPEYKGDGRYYHKSFAQVGFTSKDADCISFTELLHVPTVGRNSLQPSDLSASHLAKLNQAITHGKVRYVFLPAGVLRLMRQTSSFPWLPAITPSNNSQLKLVCKVNGKSVYEHLHFSVYGKFQQRKVQEAAAINALICGDN